MVRAAVMPGPDQPIEIREFPVPELEAGAVLLRTTASEVCGTDVHLWHGRLAGVPYPLIPGHVNVGTVEETSGLVTDVDGKVLEPGDTVTFLDVHETCNECWYCLVARAPTRCPHRKVYGITYGADEGLLGGWSEKIYLKPGVKIVSLPKGLPADTFIAAGCGLPTAFHAVERAGMRMGDSVAVLGSGPVGLSTVVFAQLHGASRVILIGGPEERLEMGRRLGADNTLNIDDLSFEERLQCVRELTSGRGVDVAIEVAGAPEAVPQAMEYARDAGTVVVAGQYTDGGDIELNPHLLLNKKHLDVRGTWGVAFSHFYRALQLMGKYHTRFPWHAMISRRYGLDEVEEALRDVESWAVTKAVIAPNG